MICRRCYWWKRRWHTHGTCWQHQVTTAPDETCSAWTAKVIRLEVIHAR